MQVLQKCVLAAFALVYGGVLPAQAAVVNSPTGLASPTTTITFDEIALADGQVIDDEFTPYGVTFSPNLYYSGGNGGCGPGACTGMDGQILVNFLAPQVLDFTMIFSGPVSAAAFAAIDNNGQYLIQALLGGSLVEQTQLAISDFPGQGFIGFEGILFDRIRVQALSPTNFGMDNLQLAQVPEPSTFALFGLALAGLIVARRRTQ